MKLSELHALNEQRTKGKWFDLGPPNIPGESNFRLQIGPTIWPMTNVDSAFIAAAANHFDALLDLWREVEVLVKHGFDPIAYCCGEKIRKILAALEAL